MTRILVTGGTGNLAAELKPHLDAEYVGIEDWDFTYPIKKGEYDLIVHMGAYTDVKKAETERSKCFMTNAYGTWNMVDTYKDTPFIYISTEWAHNPISVYALSKQLGEEAVKTLDNYLILRTLFKPSPFPFTHAYADQWTQGDYTPVIAKILAGIIKEWKRDTQETRFLGTGRKTVYDLAKQTRRDVLPNSVDDYTKAIGMNIVPKDYVELA